MKQFFSLRVRRQGRPLVSLLVLVCISLAIQGIARGASDPSDPQQTPQASAATTSGTAKPNKARKLCVFNTTCSAVTSAYSQVVGSPGTIGSKFWKSAALALFNNLQSSCGLNSVDAERQVGATLQKVFTGRFSVAGCAAAKRVTRLQQACVFNTTCTDVTATYRQVAENAGNGTVNRQFWHNAALKLFGDLQTECGTDAANARAEVGATLQKVINGKFSIARCATANGVTAQQQECVFNTTCTDITKDYQQLVGGGTAITGQFWKTAAQKLLTDLETACGLNATNAEAIDGATLQQVMTGKLSSTTCSNE